jgi:hypothetical protein
MGRLSYHFVYALRIEGTTHPFYVGKGTYTTRPYAHFTQTRRGDKSLKASIIRKADRLGLKICVDFMFSTTDEQEAFTKECELIAYWGRRGIDDGGILANLTAGGDGRCGNTPSEEQRHRQSLAMQGKVRTPEHCAALSLAKKGHEVSAETRRKLAIVNAGKKLGTAHRAKVREKLIGRPVSVATRQKMSQSAQGRIITHDQREAIRQALLGRSRPESEVDTGSETTRVTAAQHILTQQKSGLSQKQYCELHGIREQTFSGWKRSPYVKQRLQASA